ncbi:hypothetical protein SERLA73DRAFT_70044 [Serpula lacrymans var. lacrymans S7.3]|uniref:Uncharacterized protein n=2 Tax=Serpula lacrymans var. lacrymans TaxID=341189 RepID=F8PLQ5_SERL3|nr:uncharacterized protein SERLADRAFT_434151 [Serpula lacrymans var. lacrymans S7.9]EGO02537.1 hypothetical protein SERLA73DRAFT_70044 [Serpula lacrymans var. lacrymans S7.3]EGO28257.1 hypothetical protein SERLADRAFT_434151 [Serpula lacrymans var. lacrymans S7.9]
MKQMRKKKRVHPSHPEDNQGEGHTHKHARTDLDGNTTVCQHTSSNTQSSPQLPIRTPENVLDEVIAEFGISGNDEQKCAVKLVATDAVPYSPPMPTDKTG